jgi:hypothetical protein
VLLEKTAYRTRVAPEALIALTGGVKRTSTSRSDSGYGSDVEQHRVDEW